MATLPKRTLGRTGLEVTLLGYGTMELRGPPRGRDVSPEQTGRILNAVLDAGINFVDTSIDYGQSEECIGRFLSHRRSEYFLASKCGCAVGESSQPLGALPHVYTRENIVAGVEQSLRRMRTDRLDLVQVHGSPTRRILEENGAVETLLDLKRRGKVRFIGMSSTLPDLRDHVAMGVFDTFQVPYSALDRSHEEAIREASTAGAGIIVRGGAARGAPVLESPSGRHGEAWQRARLDEILPLWMSRMEFIVRFTISHPDLDTAIVGTISPDHLQQNLEAIARGALPADLHAEACRRLREAGSAPAPG
ncbi:MAG: aldo/keto reductase [Planctomycetales bacterium]|nr:aldo/keto reductase [Planctomycetales bacterium]